MNKIDPVQLEKDIEAIPVCDDAKKTIKTLFENNFGVEFEKENKIETGNVFHNRMGCYYVKINSGHLKDSHGEFCTSIAFDGKIPPYPTFAFGWGNGKSGEVLVAKSIEEYFRKKFAGEL